MTVELEELDTLDPSYDNLPIILSCDIDGVASLEGLPNIDEAYEMRISEAGIAIRARKPHGLFNGVISLMQLLPPYAQMSGDIKLDCMEVSSVADTDYHYRALTLSLASTSSHSTLSRYSSVFPR